MKISEYFDKVPALFDWYFKLVPLKRIQLNYIFLIALILFFTYKNDSKHRENYNILIGRLDSATNSRAEDQEKYSKKLEFYTDKFNHLLEILIKQERKIDQIENNS